MIRKFLLTAALAVTAALAAPSASQAGFTLTINATVITDGNLISGDIDGTVNGSILVNGTYSGYNFDFYRASTSDPMTGEPFKVDQQGKIKATANGLPVLTVLATSTGFTTPGSLLITNSIGFSGTLYGVAKSSTTVSPGGTTADATAQVINTPTTLIVTPAASFTMSNLLTVTGLKKDEVNNLTATSEAVNPAPAPAGLILAALGLPAFGLLRRKFSKVVA